jgi:hypothetical protein
MPEIRNIHPIKLTLLGILAALAVSVAVVPRASAQGFAYCYPKAGGAFEESGCKHKGASQNDAYGIPAAGGVLAFCEEQAGGSYRNAYCTERGSSAAWELKSSAVAVPKLSGTSGTSKLTIEVSGAPLEITCNAGTFQAQPRTEGDTSEGGIELKSCAVTKPSGCTVKEPIVANFDGGMAESAGKPIYKFAGSGSEETLTTLSLTGKGCGLLAGINQVKGSQTCELDKDSRVLEEKHELICKASGSNMKVGARSVTYESTTAVKAEGGYGWTPAARSPASAHKVRYCHKVGLEEGAFRDNKCAEAGGAGEYVSAWSGPSGKLLACLKVASGKGSYQDSGCSEPGGADCWE